MRCKEPVTLADDGRVHVSTNSIHYPMGVVIVHHVEESKSAPWHPLNQSLPKVVEGHRNLHDLVLRMAVTCTEQHHLMMTGQHNMLDI